MHVIKPADRNHWEAVYVDHTGKRRRKSTGCTDKKAARAKLKEIVLEVEAAKAAAIAQAERRAKGVEEITLEAALALYVSNLEAQGKHNSAYNAGSLMRKALGRIEARKPHPKRKGSDYVPPPPVAQAWHLDPTMPLESLTPRHLEELIQARRREGLSASTIGHELKLIRAASAFCGELGYGTPAIEKWRIPKAAHKTRYLSPQEYAAVLEELGPAKDGNGLTNKYRQEARDLLVVLVMTGGRWSEIASLTWPRVNLEEEKVTIWGSKTQRERAVPLPSLALDVLRRRMVERNAPQAQGEDNDAYTKRRHNPYVFPSRDLESHRKSSCRPISDAIDRAGLNSPEKVRASGRATVHSLRHTHASWLLANGADLSDVQEALGHTTLQMTRRYAHLSREQSLKRLGAAMGRAVEALSVPA